MVFFLKNEFSDNKFNYLNKPGENSISEDFETLDGLYTYLLSKDFASNVAKLYGTSEEDIAEYTQLFEIMQNSLRSHNFIWSEVPLPDYQIGVVFNESGSTYEYYLYNGEEWIKLENKDVVIVTKSITSGSPIDTQLAALTFTFDEVNLLKTGAELNIDYALNSQQVCTAYAQKVCTVTSDDDGILTYDLTFYPTATQGVMSLRICAMAASSSSAVSLGLFLISNSIFASFLSKDKALSIPTLATASCVDFGARRTRVSLPLRRSVVSSFR